MPSCLPLLYGGVEKATAWHFLRCFLRCSEALDEAHSRAGRWTPQTVSVCGESPVSCREGAGSWSGQISCRSCSQSGRGHAWLVICGVNVSEHVMARYDKIWQVITMRWNILKYEYANAHFTVLFHSIFQVSESLPQVHREKKWNVWPWAWFWDVLGRSFKKGLLVRQALWFIVQFTPLAGRKFYPWRQCPLCPRKQWVFSGSSACLLSGWTKRTNTCKGHVGWVLTPDLNSSLHHQRTLELKNHLGSKEK